MRSTLCRVTAVARCLRAHELEVVDSSVAFIKELILLETAQVLLMLYLLLNLTLECAFIRKYFELFCNILPFISIRQRDAPLPKNNLPLETIAILRPFSFIGMDQIDDVENSVYKNFCLNVVSIGLYLKLRSSFKCSLSCFVP